MQLHTFRARSLQEALRLVRQQLGPDASVLETREVGSTVTRWLGGAQIEVTASAEVRVPSRLPHQSSSMPRADLHDFRRQFRAELQSTNDEPSVVEQLSRPRHASLSIVPPQIPRSTEVAIRGPIRLIPSRRQVIALVGPTGVGKTTTIAKLAAQFRLREQARVALITVDTYRIAAVEQLRTYAEIMDLPLEVVSTPREMRIALNRLTDFDLVFVDTAGRSPRDAVRLQELRSLLADAHPDEVCLVLSAVAGENSLRVAASAFTSVGASSLILTKLDEATALDWLPALAADHQLAVSYTTNGQNVPDDIRAASPAQLAKLLAGGGDGGLAR